ncbi:S8 family serine peptidase [Streptomyces endophyticus]|uniref:S8 family serine peptidase n=1 Tax=Streptomyces endophyticus TaxID=714166 RepID=A0ABU6FIX3_9ACTN|nr:S8 family serine peptidase [Streptomyces endophyticus]MEB8344003.1 S8 family serine peptidase [Streptomyces endophyticus]
MPLPRPPRRRRAVWAAASLTAAAALLTGAIPAVADSAQADSATAKVDSALAKAVSKGDDATFFVVLKDKADLSAAKQQRSHAKAATAAYKSLKAHAADSQKPLNAFLDKEKVGHQDFWITNAVKVTGDQDLVKELAKRSDVKEIVKERKFTLDGIETSDAKVTKDRSGVASSADGTDTPEWGVADIKADKVWDQYEDRGEGIVIANVDTGVQYNHPDLVKQYRGNNGDGTFTNDYNFYDPTGNCAADGTPCDNNGHGTHTMGTMVGKNGLGVAPNAKWIAAKGCESGECSDGNLLAAGQWILAPTDHNGQNARPDLAPNIVNNSWGQKYGTDPFYEDIIDAWKSAGIFEAFAAGNFGDGQTCSTTDPPGAQVDAYGVGAYDSSGNVAKFTGFGPSRIDGSMKPNITAPGVDVQSAWLGTSYNTISGTSMATPHVAGAVALLWSAAPSLVGNIDETRKLLDAGATDVDDTHCGGTADANNVWGNGKLDILSTIDKAPHTAVTVSGKITDKASGKGLADATVKATNDATTRTVTTGADGSYRLSLPPGTYTFSLSAYGYAADTVSGVELTTGEPLTQDAALTPVPQHAVTGTVLDVTGEPLAKATVSLPGNPVEAVTTDAQGKFSLPKVAEGAYTLRAAPAAPVVCNGTYNGELKVDGDKTADVKLPNRTDAGGTYACAPVASSWIKGSTATGLTGDEDAKTIGLPFPVKYYGVSYTSASITTNGLVNFLQPRLGEYANTALPAAAQPNGVVAALWDDLVLDKRSSVQTAVTGKSGARKFAIVWNNAAFASDTSVRISFEAVLDEATGAVTLQYKGIGDSALQRGGSATTGIENQAGTDGLGHSFNETVLSDATAIRFTPKGA